MKSTSTSPNLKVRAEGFGEVIVRAELEALDFVAVLTASGQDENGRGAAARSQCAADVEAIQLRHHQIENDGIGVIAGGFHDALLPVFRSDDIVTIVLEIVLEAFEQLDIVFDDEDSLHHHTSRDSATTGSVTVKVVPQPLSLATVTVPP